MKINKLHTYFGLLIFTLILFSCKEEKLPLLDIKSNEVQFYATGSFNSDSIKIEAGVDNYYMESSYYLDSRNLYVLKSNLEQYNCKSCVNSLEISVSNVNFNPVIRDFNIDSIFYQGRKIPLFFDTSNLPMNISHALIVVKDPYSFSHYSKLYYQPSNFITINKVEPYKNNRLGQKTVKVSFYSECYLKNDSLPVIDSVRLQGVFAFAYPSL